MSRFGALAPLRRRYDQACGGVAACEFGLPAGTLTLREAGQNNIGAAVCGTRSGSYSEFGSDMIEEQVFTV